MSRTTTRPPAMSARSSGMRSAAFCIVLCVLLALGGCGGGGGAVGPDSDELQPSPPPPPSCVRTVLGCLTREKFLEERATIEAGHEGAGDYANQWG